MKNLLMKRQAKNCTRIMSLTAKRTLLATVVVAAIGIAPGAAMASTYPKQQAETYPSQQGASATAPHASSTANGNPAAAEQFSDEQLKSFAKAQKSVDEARADMSAKLQATQDPNEASAVRANANEKMLTAVEQSGLTREQYNNIARAVALDPQIASKVESYR